MPRSRPGPVTGRPATNTSPLLGCRNPAIKFSTVLLPQPEGPMIDINSPISGVFSTVKDTSCSAVKEPNRTHTLRNSTIGGSEEDDVVTGVPAGKETVRVQGAPKRDRRTMQ